jgi:hypothetical protein
MDIGGPYARAMVSAMNTASQIGSFASSLAFGYLVAHYGNYNLPFVPMALLLATSAVLWLRVDPTKPLGWSEGAERTRSTARQSTMSLIGDDQPCQRSHEWTVGAGNR